MNNQTIRIITEKPNTWDTVVSHPLQSWAWGEFRKETGIDVVRIGVFEDAELVDGWQVTFHSLPHTPFTIGYFPKGPNPNQHMIQALADLGKKKKALFIQFEPNVLTTDNQQPTHNSQLTTHNHLPPSHHPLFTKYTFVLNITKSEEELTQSMHSKTRYNLKVAQKNNVTIQEDSSQKAFEEYLKLTQETTKRQGFYAHSQTYHQKMWNTLSQSKIAKLFTATYKDKVLAAWIIFAFGDTLYYPYGASSREHKEVMAPTLLLWEIVRWGKKNGYKKFDLWGAMGPNPDQSDPWFGFHRFKAGFTPTLVEFVGSFDLVINKILYQLYCLVDTLRWFILKKIRS